MPNSGIILENLQNNKSVLSDRSAKLEKTRPFLKWAGGKSGQLTNLSALAPKNFRRYIEPFVGGGALFFNLSPKSALVSDSNGELINAYRVVRDFPELLLEKVSEIPIDEDTFYKIRETDPLTLNQVDRAARLIYLNKTCYNGLYRVNKKGKFNTPFGKNSRAVVSKREVIIKASNALKNAEVVCDDFERILLDKAIAEDFIYLDPPYPPVGRYADFTRYTRHFFNEEDHLRLAKAVEEIDDRKCTFILSNANHPLILKLYSKFRTILVNAHRYINCRGDQRGYVSEILVTNI